MRALLLVTGLAAASTACSTSADGGEDILNTLRACDLVGATYAREGKSVTLHMRRDLFPSLEETPAAEGIACFTQWAREEGYHLTVEQVTP